MGFNPLKRKIIQNHQKILIQWVKKPLELLSRKETSKKQWGSTH